MIFRRYAQLWKRRCRRIVIENIGKNQRNTKLQNDAFEAKTADLLDNNKTEGVGIPDYQL